MDNRKQSAWAIITNLEDKYLLLLRGPKSNNPGLYNFPGGTVDPGEKPQVTATRELFEEAGITTRFLTFKRLILLPKVECFFYERKLKKDITPKINAESAKYGWFTHEDALKLKLHPPTLAYMQHTK